jgi:hypothetical protein
MGDFFHLFGATDFRAPPRKLAATFGVERTFFLTLPIQRLEINFVP